MKKIRYFTETLPDNPDPHHPSQVSNACSTGGLGHWIRISSSTILGIVSLSDIDFAKFLQDHPTVAILPSLHDKVKIKDHLATKNKGNHKGHFDDLIEYCGAQVTDTTSDVISKMIAKGHTFLHPDQ